MDGGPEELPLARPGAPTAADLYRWLRSRAEGWPGRTAFVFHRRDGTATEWTYERLFSETEALAARLPTDLPPGPVGILVDEQEQQVLHHLALLSRNRVPCTLTPPHHKLEPAYYAATMRAVLAAVRFGALISDVAGLDRGAPVVLTPGSLAERGRGDASEAQHLDLLGAAFVQLSSGTTGIKKAMAVTARAAQAQLDAYGAAIGMTADDVVISWLPLYHDMGFITALHLPLAFGAATVMMHPVDWVRRPGRYLELVTEHGGTLGWQPNFALRFTVDRIRSLEGLDLSSLRGLANCSEPATTAAQSAYADLLAPAGLRPGVFWGCYAMAETTFAVTHSAGTLTDGLDFEGPAGQVGVPRPVPTVGRPLPGVEVQIEGDGRRLVADGQLGEIVIRAPFLAAGYVGHGAATGARFRDGTYRTGDLGYRRGDLLYVTGRKDDLIIAAGVNIHPGDIEALVSAEPGVQPGRVAAFADFDERAQTERITVLLEPADPAVRPDMKTIRVRLIGALELSNFEVRTVPRGWLVKTSSGKMARKASHQKWLAERSRQPGETEPAS